MSHQSRALLGTGDFCGAIGVGQPNMCHRDFAFHRDPGHLPALGQGEQLDPRSLCIARETSRNRHRPVTHSIFTSVESHSIFYRISSWKNNLRRLVVSWAHLRIESPLSPVTLQFVPVLMNSSQAMRTFCTSGAQPGYPMLSWRISYGVKPNWSWEISTIVEYVKQK